MNEFTVRLDLAKGKARQQQTVFVRQGDKNATTIVATITDHGAAAATSGLTARFQMRLPDGTHYYRKAASLSGNVATVTLDEAQAASVAGRTDVAYFQLLQGSTVVASTESFTVVVLPDALADATVPESYDSAIQDAIDALDAAVADMPDMVEDVLADHPEWTTTVQDGSITPPKLSGNSFDALHVGSAASLTGNEPTEATFLDRACPGTTGQATVQSVRGNTVVQDGSLLPVRMEGIETVGFNQWDEEWESGAFNTSTGEKVTANTRIRSKNPIHVFPETDYYLKFGNYSLGGQGLDICFYDANGAFVSFLRKWSAALTIPAGVHYMTWSTQAAYGTTYNHDICINISDPARNGTYEPHWRSERAIPASTYFPDGLRSAGSVRDELTATQAITRVGERAYQSGDESDASVITDGTVTHYALATPTTTPIDPPLNLTYRAEHGGTETITHTEQSAPPVLSIAYGHTAEGIVQQAASAIAAQDGPTATANHAVGSYLTMGGTLYRVTTAIATGEAITPGTNVTATTVMAEVLSLIQ